MILHVYRLRRRGQRQDSAAMAVEGTRGDLRLEPPGAASGRAQTIAYLVRPGTSDELLPRLLVAKVRIREAILLTGLEEVPRGRGAGRYPQTWVCTPQPIPPPRWAALSQPTADHTITGFDPADDDDLRA